MNLPDDHIAAELVLTAADARSFINGNDVSFIEQLDTAIDLAQGSAIMKAHHQYVVIRVVP